MVGYGAAQTWGLELAADIAAYRQGEIGWSDVDCGLLLSGSPGTGKTMFARALAHSCDVPLVHGSLGQWQAHRSGHLGDMLAAMRACFAEAQAQAPAILFIDELDGIGDRSRFTHVHSTYSIQVVNHLLELIDGTASREGVIVLGACNHPDMIDPALLRAGRLDRHIEIARPDPADLAVMLRQHLGAEAIAALRIGFPDTVSDADLCCALEGVVEVGQTGADMERLAREARRRLRRTGHLTLACLRTVQNGDGDQLSGGRRWRAAIHEAGHAVAAKALGCGSVRSVRLKQGGRSGLTEIFYNDDDAPTRKSLQDRVAVILAGRAAEEIVLGEASSGAGGPAHSDLALATGIMRDLVTRLGLGAKGSLLWDNSAGEGVPFWLSREIAAELDAVYQRSLDLVRVHRDEIEALARSLM